ncbi:SDR family NAD(P)-dependent oxidoreductase, partial [Nocardia beijingensis]
MNIDGGAAGDEIAIVGLSCRASGVEDPDGLWQLLAEGGSTIGKIPDGRNALLDAADIAQVREMGYPSLSAAPIFHGGYLADVDKFDAEFFGIAPREADSMDPQQRLTLELAWEALEDAGIIAENLRRAPLGVFLGVGGSDYSILRNRRGIDSIDRYAAAGSGRSIIANRISRILDLRGPSITVDTGQSSSLCAVHMACESIRSGSVSAALAGGVQLNLTCDSTIAMSRLGVLSPDGKCFTFDARANGFVRGEGGGIVLLKPLRDAVRDGNKIYAVIRGGAIGSEGTSSSVAAPSADGQRDVLAEALSRAGVAAEDVDYVELHGTGTAVGDVVEASALGDIYGSGRPEDARLPVGSVKTNIGHLEAAAGIVGLIKVVLALTHGQLPPSLNYSTPNPKIDFARLKLRVVDELVGWPESNHPRRAGVSSFGMGGTNAHLIVEQAPEDKAAAERTPPRALPTVPWVVSARSRQALLAQARRLHDHLERDPGLSPVDVGLSLATRRSVFEHRAVVLGSDRDELLRGLRGLTEQMARRRAGRTVFVFPGQGSQWFGMAVELLDSSPVFADKMRECAEAFGPLVDWSLLDVLHAADGAPGLERVDVVQPVLFAVMVSLAELWRSCGVYPDAVVGHSQGEIAAAYVAGALSLEDAARVVVLRARALIDVAGTGGMASVSLPVELVRTRLSSWDGRLGVAAVNGSSSVVVSGRREALDEFLVQCEADGVRARRVAVDYASHSPQVEVLREPLLTALADIDARQADVAFYSTVTGAAMDTTGLDAGYWYRNLRETVLFEGATLALTEQGHDVFVEVSPHPVLTVGIEETCEKAGKPAVVVGSLRRDEGGMGQFLVAAGELFVAGVPVDWPAVFAGCGGHAVDLPTYAFQRRRFWLDDAAGAADVTGAGLDAVRHPLLGAVAEVGDRDEWLFTGRIGFGKHKWMADHIVLGAVVLPAAAVVELVLHAGARLGVEVVDEIALGDPLVVDGVEHIEVRLTVRAADATGRRGFSLHSRAVGELERNESRWTQLATGVLTGEASDADRPANIAVPAGVEPTAGGEYYERLAAEGFNYGPAFQGVTAVWPQPDEVVAEVSLEESVEADADAFGIHPTLFDAVVNCGVVLLGDDSPPGYVRTVAALAGVRLLRRGASSIRLRARRLGVDAVRIDAVDETGAPVLAVDSVRIRHVEPRVYTGGGDIVPLHAFDWVELPRTTARRSVSVAVMGTPMRRFSLRFAGVADVAAAETVPEAVVWAVDPPSDDGNVEEIQDRIRLMSDVLRDWFAEPRLSDTKLIALTRHASGLADAMLAGLVRSLQSEYPGRVMLVDVANSVDGIGAAELAAVLDTDEAEVAVRGDRLLVRRLSRVETTQSSARPSFGAGTVLITGGTTGIGALVARHLVVEHGVEHLLLLERDDVPADTSIDIASTLAGHPVDVRIVKCDAADRDAIHAAIDTVDPDHPLTAVLHGLDSLNEDHVDSSSMASAVAALNLHDFAKHTDLSAFVLFTSATTMLGVGMHTPFAAAGAGLMDAVTGRRLREGLPALSVALGPWPLESARPRPESRGMSALSSEEALAFLDSALAGSAPSVLGIKFDRAAMAVRAHVGALPSSLRALFPTRVKRAATIGSLAQRLILTSETDRDSVVLEFVREHAAKVLGYTSVETIDAELPFTELGFDSAGGVELRNQLAMATGVALPSSLVFDYPTPMAVARRLRALVEGADPTRRSRKAAPRSLEEPIAIVGMSCRFPGGVGSPAELWELLTERRDAITGFPTDRGWNLEKLYDPDPDRPGTVYVTEGGFLSDAGDFDAEFFGIGPREALAMDPQQRLILEASWEALEDAGIDPGTLRGSDTAVFVGACDSGYSSLVVDDLERYRLTGTSHSVISGRVAYALGLEGPAITVDTACSSSLVAVHVACQALRHGETSMVLAGGVAVSAAGDLYVDFARQRGMAPDGRSKAFAASANGVVWSEGVGVLVLERLLDAKRLGHNVLAVVRGSAVNQDGASNGLTAPNGPSQERVIAQALANAGLRPADVSAVEAHGTGTALGDPIEAQALISAYGDGRVEPLRIGSVKSNLGHAVAAAGMAGLIKMVQALRHEVLPATLHVDSPTPHVDWSAGVVRLLTEPEPWPAAAQPRRAGVSSFGISGTNAHVIVEEAPPSAVASGPDSATGFAGEHESESAANPPFVLSAKTADALRAQAGKLRDWLIEHDGATLPDVAYSLATARARLDYRGVVVGRDRDQMLTGLAELAVGSVSGRAVEGKVKPGKTAVLFTGQGAQRVGMGAALYGAFDVFASALDEVCAVFDPLLGCSLIDVVFAKSDKSELHRTRFTQPALFAVEVALYRLVEAFGVEPDVLLGHSIGELVAAYVAGVWSLEDACTLVAARGRLMDELPEDGAMLSISMSQDEADEVVAAFGNRVSIAAVNTPGAVVISGERPAMAEIDERLSNDGIKTTRLRVGYGFHSALMEPMLAEFAEVASGLTYRTPRIPLVSNVSGKFAGDEITEPAYWVRQVREAVRFAQGIATVSDWGARRFLELGPDEVLATLARQCLSEDVEARSLIAAACRRDTDEPEQLLRFLANAHSAGVTVDWCRLFADRSVSRVSLPTYAFQRDRYWLQPRENPAGGGVSHPFVRGVMPLAGRDEWLITGGILPGAESWIADHMTYGAVVVPSAMLVEILLVGGRMVGCPVVDELTLEAPIMPTENDEVEFQVLVQEPDHTGRRPFTFYFRILVGGTGEWIRNGSGTLMDESPEDDLLLARLQHETWPPAGATTVDKQWIPHQIATGSGLEYGPAFIGVVAAWQRDETVYSEVALDVKAASRPMRFELHPALLDLVMHAGLACLVWRDLDANPETGRLLFRWSGVRLHTTANATSLRVIAVANGSEAIRVAAVNDSGSPVVSVDAVVMRPYDVEKLRGVLHGTADSGLYQTEWLTVSSPSTPVADRMAVLGESPVPGIAARYPSIADLLEAQSIPDVVVWRAADDQAGPAKAKVTLALLQRWLSEKRLADARLVVVTDNAAALAGEIPDCDAAAVWGLIRSAQSEHPGRFIVVDDDPASSRVDAAFLMRLLATGEPQVAARADALLVPRLTRAPAPIDRGPVFGAGTVLITGGTGGLGALVARHLASEHGVRRLLLVSRRGPAADGIAELVRELAELGAHADAVACDVGDRMAVRALVDSVGSEYPLTGVVHAAGVLDDATIARLTTDQMDRVWASKAAAAWHLHRETRNLSAFVLFSSVSALLGSPGQANYAAANGFLDALAQLRRIEGLPAISLAWGPWSRNTGMTATLNPTSFARWKWLGMRPLDATEGLRRFDAALRSDHANLAPMHFNAGALRHDLGDVPAVLRGFMRKSATPSAAAPTSSLGTRLSRVPEARRAAVVLDVVRVQAAAVLGRASADEISAEERFGEIGFDSLGGVEFRNRLAKATGLSLPSTLVFDYPTASAVANFVLSRVEGLAKPQTPIARTARVDEPIAIVGTSCRFPGGVESPGQLWNLVAGGVDGIGEFPTDRGWDLERLFDADADKPGTIYTRGGGFLYEAGDFDASFFGIGPREALAMDPQQRLLLEASWEALEDAGIDPITLRGRDVGVFAGACDSAYSSRIPADLEGFHLTGTTHSVVSGRIAYTLGLEGPAVTVDTACSSSLVALHLACQELRQGGTSLALASGVTVAASPYLYIDFARHRGLSADGRCKSFAASADGVAFSEGVGVLVLERLSDARRNGHRVLALVRGSAVNQDGASNGLTAPSGPAQQRLIHTALANAGVSAAEVDAVEAHGTGTRLGDPIEAQALIATYGQDRAEGQPLWLGSVKSNIGHTVAAAGVAGVIKIVEAMRRETLPPTLHVDEPTPHVDWSSGGVRLLTEARPWPRLGHPRRAGVSSFGISGTNAHVIIEQAPEDPTLASRTRSTPAGQPPPNQFQRAYAATNYAEAVRDSMDRTPAHRLTAVEHAQTDDAEVVTPLADEAAVDRAAVVERAEAAGVAVTQAAVEQAAAERVLADGSREQQAQADQAAAERGLGVVPWVVSGRDGAALAGQAGRLLACVEA